MVRYLFILNLFIAIKYLLLRRYSFAWENFFPRTLRGTFPVAAQPVRGFDSTLLCTLFPPYYIPNFKFYFLFYLQSGTI